MPSIHEMIKAARLRKGWSMERLAEEIAKAEGLKKPLAWQTVQQWERTENGTAPKRTRLGIVAKLLDMELVPTPGSASVAGDDPEDQQLLAAIQVLGAHLGKADRSARASVTPLISLLGDDPAETRLIAQRIAFLLGSSATTQQPSDDRVNDDGSGTTITMTPTWDSNGQSGSAEEEQERRRGLRGIPGNGTSKG